MPLPGDPKAVFLGGLFISGSLAAACVAQAAVLAIIPAFILKLLSQALMRPCGRAACRGSDPSKRGAAVRSSRRQARVERPVIDIPLRYALIPVKLSGSTHGVPRQT